MIPVLEEFASGWLLRKAPSQPGQLQGNTQNQVPGQVQLRTRPLTHLGPSTTQLCQEGLERPPCTVDFAAVTTLLFNQTQTSQNVR